MSIPTPERPKLAAKHSFANILIRRISLLAVITATIQGLLCTIVYTRYTLCEEIQGKSTGQKLHAIAFGTKSPLAVNRFPNLIVVVDRADNFVLQPFVAMYIGVSSVFELVEVVHAIC